MMPFTPEQIELMIERLPRVISLRELAREIGAPFRTVQEHLEPYVAILRAQNALPPCPCGKERFHPYGCSYRSRPQEKGTLHHYPPERRAEMAQRRALFVSLLESGMRLFEVDEAMGAGKGAAKWYLRHLTPEQLAARERAMAQHKEDASR